MKRYVILAVIGMVFLLAGLAVAGTAGQNAATRGFTPSSIATATRTLTVNTAALFGIKFQTSAAGQYRFNGTGTAYPLAANTPETIYLPAAVKYVNISTGTAATIHVLKQ